MENIILAYGQLVDLTIRSVAVGGRQMIVATCQVCVSDCPSISVKWRISMASTTTENFSPTLKKGKLNRFGFQSN